MIVLLLKDSRPTVTPQTAPGDVCCSVSPELTQARLYPRPGHPYTLSRPGHLQRVLGSRCAHAAADTSSLIASHPPAAQVLQPCCACPQDIKSPRAVHGQEHDSQPHSGRGPHSPHLGPLPSLNSVTSVSASGCYHSTRPCDRELWVLQRSEDSMLPNSCHSSLLYQTVFHFPRHSQISHGQEPYSELVLVASAHQGSQF